MIHRDSDCGCAINPTHDYGDLSYVIVHCPLHAAAKEMLEAAKAVQDDHEIQYAVFVSSDAQYKLQRLSAALTKATGDKQEAELDELYSNHQS